MRVDDLREVVLKPSDSVLRGGIAWRTNAQGMRDRSYPIEKTAGTFRIALVGDSIGAGWGVNGGAAVRVDPRTGLGCALASVGRPRGRDHQLRRAGSFARPALVSLRASRLADASRPGDLRVDRSRRRLGRTAAPLRAGPGPGLRFAPLPGCAGLRASRAALGPGAVQAGTPTAPSRDPGGGLSDHGGRLPGPRGADHLGADPPRRAAQRPGRSSGAAGNPRAPPDSTRSSTRPTSTTASTPAGWPSRPTTFIPTQRVMPGWPGVSTPP